MLLLTAEAVRRALPMRAAIDSQKRAFAALATGRAVLPLRTPVAVPEREAVTLFMPGRVESALGAKVVSVFPRNAGRGPPAVQGVLLLVDAETGRPAALLDATYLTALRTGAASGAATEVLAPPEARTAALLGTGAQAATQLLAVCTVRPIGRVWVYSRRPENVAAFINRMQPEVSAELVAAATAAEAVRQAEVVCTATSSPSPVFAGRDLRPGAHVNGIGSYTPDTREVDSETVRRAGRVFVDSRESALAEAGDVVIPLREGVLDAGRIIELGAVLAGRQPGRTGPEEITFFKSVGIAVQDLAAGAEVLVRARELGLGHPIDL